MISLKPWEHQNTLKMLYAKCLGEVCGKHDITRMELDILLFLANNPQYDTAKDMVEIRYLSKSQVSVSLRLLEQCGYVERKYQENNHKTIHLSVCDAASEIVRDGRQAQEKFWAIMTQGILEEDLNTMKRCMKHMLENIHHYMRKEPSDH
ncbi:MAG: MarR family transcriptional regulator [Eubacterium sp.]|nr:MarR family transcriptional regulator [Eubacterium sp.]